jgi:hypothetical protein
MWFGKYVICNNLDKGHKGLESRYLNVETRRAIAKLSALQRKAVFALEGLLSMEDFI